MWSPRLWQFCCAMLVIFILTKLTIDYLTAPDASYNDVSVKGLQVKIETGLQQIYWQWQNQGRPRYIDYVAPSESKEREIIKIATNEKGLAIVENSQQGCEQFLRWFVEEKILNKALKMTTTVVTSNTEAGEETYFCKFEYAERVFIYYPQTGDLRFLD